MAKTNGVVTKGYLDKRLNEFKGGFRDYLDKRLDEFKTEFKNELYEIKDEIVGEIKAMREEFETHQFSHSRINDEIQDHERRIAKLETP